MKSITRAALMGALLLSATAANAVTYITQTLTFASGVPGTNSQSLALFNTPNRTLQSVSIYWQPHVTTAGTILMSSGSGNTRILTAAFTLNSVLTSSAFNLTTAMTGTSGNFTVAGQGTSALVPFNLTGNGSLTPTNLAPFIGSGTISIQHSLQKLATTITRVSGGNGNTSAGIPSATGGGELLVVFGIEPLPEPATWVMFITGFGLIGASLRQKRRAPAA